MTRARDIAGGTIFTSADNTKLDGIATGATAYVHPTGAGNQHVPAAGAAGQLLQYASAGTASWATISTGADQIVSPTFASPDSTFTTSGTYSKPASVADDDYMWVFMVSGGRGGGQDTSGSFYQAGGSGGNPLLLYGKASNFHNATYVVGAGGAAGFGTDTAGAYGGTSSITLHASQGGFTYTASSSNFVYYIGGGSVTIGGTTLTGGFTGGNKFELNSIHTGWATLNTGSDYEQGGGEGGYTGEPHHSVFGGAGGGGSHASYGYFPTGSQSFLSGDGGHGSNTGAGAAGALHGGGGGAGRTSAGAGGSGSMRVYYV